MTAFYNEIDPYAAQWLRNLIQAGHIAPGVVDERSVVDIRPDDLRGFTQVHFFAGIGGWSLAARLAGWPDARPLWTGSCPCQPFSVAGAGAGQADARHLWPEFHRLIAGCRPDVVMGEQVAAAVGKSWLDGVHSDLESIGYACGAAVVPACAVDAPHRRDRLWFVADNGAGRRAGSIERQIEQPGRTETIGAGDSSSITLASCPSPGWNQRGEDAGRCAERGEAQGLEQRSRNSSVLHVADQHGARLEGRSALPERGDERAPWAHGVEWRAGADGKARRVKPGVRLLAHGISGRVVVRRAGQQGSTAPQEEHWYSRVGALKGLGNAIVPQVAAEIIGAYLDCAPD